MKEFFLDKFEYDYFATKSWIRCIEEQEDKVSPFVLKSISHIINAHHIWVCRLLNKKPESEVWDILPVPYLGRLHEHNYQETINFLEKYELNEKVNYHSAEGVKMTKNISDVLYHVLNHNNYHRAQIVMDLKQHELKYPSYNFITYR
jgi:uncharacterized damage-inducible protein DinB